MSIFDLSFSLIIFFPVSTFLCLFALCRQLKAKAKIDWSDHRRIIYWWVRIYDRSNTDFSCFNISQIMSLTNILHIHEWNVYWKMRKLLVCKQFFFILWKWFQVENWWTNLFSISTSAFYSFVKETGRHEEWKKNC